MRMSRNKGIAFLVLVVLCTAFLGYTAIAGIGPNQGGSVRGIRLGLDLEGGVSITYQTLDASPSAEDMADTIYKLQRRVEQYSTEAAVFQEGYNRISIEIPGVTDANQVLQDMGRPGSLFFIQELGSDGLPNFRFDPAIDWFVLTRTIDELREDGSIVLTGADVQNAAAVASQDQMGNRDNIVNLSFSPEGSERFAEATAWAAVHQESIAIYYDGELVSVPRVNHVITEGEATISGNMSFAEADRLASLIRIGGLTLELEELRSNVVGAQLGEDAIRTSVLAGIIGLFLVFVFMCYVYRLPGFAASVALLIYTALTLILVNAFDITLTLPGIAGIILGIGMAVDANIIIFARVKEEMTEGQSIRVALRLGFQRALPAILDSNITTLIIAAILWLRGSGPIRGFAHTLALGIIVSMFTALVVTRLLINAFYAVGIRKEKLYAKRLKKRRVLDYVGNRYKFFAFSTAVILIGFITMAVNGAGGRGALNYSLEFVGGTASNVTFNEDFSLAEIDSQIVPLISDITGEAMVIVQKVEGTNEVIFRTSVLNLDERVEFSDLMVTHFDVDPSLITTENISATTSAEMRFDAVIAVILAMLAMLLYIWFRFKDIRFAGSTVIALICDVLFVLTCYALVRLAVGNTFIAVMLTAAGYSINDTIVTFDRVREELKKGMSQRSLKELINYSITATLTRTLYTTFSTFVTLAVLFIVGISSIREFTLPLMVGLLSGAYTTVCITGGLWYMMNSKLKKQGRAEEVVEAKVVEAKA